MKRFENALTAEALGILCLKNFGPSERALMEAVTDGLSCLSESTCSWGLTLNSDRKSMFSAMNGQVGVMLNFMSALDWAQGCPDSW